MVPKLYSIDDYAYQSPMRNYSAGLKFWFVLIALLLCLWLNDANTSVYCFITMSFVTVYTNKVPWAAYGKLLCIPAAFIFLSCVAIAVEIQFSPSGFTFFWNRTTLSLALQTMLRGFGGISLLYFLALSTPMNEIISLLRRLYVPDTITELMFFTYRYLFILLDIQYQIKIAAQSRLGYCDFKTACVTLGRSIGNGFILSLRRNRQFLQGLEARLYTGNISFLNQEFQNPFMGAVLAFCYLCSMVGIHYGFKGCLLWTM